MVGSEGGGLEALPSWATISGGIIFILTAATMAIRFMGRLIGGKDDNTKQGAAWVFGRSGSTWSPQGRKLTGLGETGAGEFGSSVALSSDGNRALVGGPADQPGAPAYGKGAAWVAYDSYKNGNYDVFVTAVRDGKADDFSFDILERTHLALRD